MATQVNLALALIESSLAAALVFILVQRLMAPPAHRPKDTIVVLGLATPAAAILVVLFALGPDDERQRAQEHLALMASSDLSSGDLAGKDLRGIALAGKDLSYADLRGADLRGADLRSADLSAARLNGAILRGANVANANLSDADLRRADLTAARLTGATLRASNLTMALLRGAQYDETTRWPRGFHPRRAGAIPK